MTRIARLRRSPTIRASWIAVLVFSAAPGAHAEDVDAILSAMTDYVSGQTALSFDFDTGIEVVTSDLQKLEFTSSGHLDFSRPDKLRVSRTGGYADVEFVFDGNTATLLGRHLNKYVQMAAPGSVDNLIDRIRTEHGIDVPGGDLLVSGLHEELMADVLESKHVGRGVIDGVECEHLAFRNQDVDWQLWIEVGDRPVPRQYVITSKTVTGAPEYTLRIRNWNAGRTMAAQDFAFVPPAGAQPAASATEMDVDEVPHGLPAGERQ